MSDNGGGDLKGFYMVLGAGGAIAVGAVGWSALQGTFSSAATVATASIVTGEIEDLAELVSRSLRADAERRSARHHYHPGEVALYPRLVPAMLAAKKGELMGPLEVDGGWSVFRVAYANEGGIEPFDSVQRQARALLLKRRQQSALGAFLQHLRDTHASVVVIHAEHLAKALPDEVL